METEAIKPFDLEDVYDEQIAPLMAQILEICQKHNMGMVASFAYRNDPFGDFDVCTSALGNETQCPKEYALFVRNLMG